MGTTVSYKRLGRAREISFISVDSGWVTGASVSLADMRFKKKRDYRGKDICLSLATEIGGTSTLVRMTAFWKFCVTAYDRGGIPGGRG